MQTARVTVLMTPDGKADLESRAAELGVSSGQFIRLAVDNYDPQGSTEGELAALAREVNAIIPKMRKSLDQSSESLQAAHAEVDQILRQLGLRA